MAWKKPKDDGGCEIDRTFHLNKGSFKLDFKNLFYYFLDYEVEQYDVETGKWRRVGKSKGTEFEVTGLTKGKKYKFRRVQKKILI